MCWVLDNYMGGYVIWRVVLLLVFALVGMLSFLVGSGVIFVAGKLSCSLTADPGLSS